MQAAHKRERVDDRSLKKKGHPQGKSERKK
jgi:hypothetical protein